MSVNEQEDFAAKKQTFLTKTIREIEAEAEMKIKTLKDQIRLAMLKKIQDVEATLDRDYAVHIANELLDPVRANNNPPDFDPGKGRVWKICTSRQNKEKKEWLESEDFKQRPSGPAPPYGYFWAFAWHRDKPNYWYWQHIPDIVNRIANSGFNGIAGRSPNEYKYVTLDRLTKLSYEEEDLSNQVRCDPDDYDE